jgi:hypothetical protein
VPRAYSRLWSAPENTRPSNGLISSRPRLGTYDDNRRILHVLHSELYTLGYGSALTITAILCMACNRFAPLRPWSVNSMFTLRFDGLGIIFWPRHTVFRCYLAERPVSEASNSLLHTQLDGSSRSQSRERQLQGAQMGRPAVSKTSAIILGSLRLRRAAPCPRLLTSSVRVHTTLFVHIIQNRHIKSLPRLLLPNLHAIIEQP